MSSYQEVEAKLFVPDLKVVTHRLELLGAKLTAPRVFERNVRYEDAQHTLTSRGIVVRLRQDTHTRLTYKESGSVEQGIISRTEIEVEVSDFDAMDALLGKLGYQPHVVYEKYRTTYELDNAEIVLDEMPYGNFVEIEGDQMTIESVIDRLQLGDAPRIMGSYLAVFEQVKQRLKLDFHDLTFANFQNVNVPDTAIY